MTGVIHPTAVIAGDVQLGAGSSVGPFCVVGIDGTEADAPCALGRASVVRSHTVLYRGVVTGDGFMTGHGVLIRESSVLGHHVSVGSHSVIEHHVRVADRVRIHSDCFIPEFSVLEEGCWIGPGVRLTNARYPNRPDTKDKLEGVTVGAGAVVGAGAILLPGVVIGAGATVGAGAVVVHDVAAGATVVGNPARTLTH
jgi:acetyltransferase-like isoleucine patch superfamily enzyme